MTILEATLPIIIKLKHQIQIITIG